jgi:hypothetical protein
MPELSAAQKRLQELRAERTRAAYNAGRLDTGRGGTRAAPTAKPAAEFHEGVNAASAKYQNRQQREEQPTRVVPNRQKSTAGSAKTYQKHVAFAIVTAFLIKMVAAGKLNG